MGGLSSFSAHRPGDAVTEPMPVLWGNLDKKRHTTSIAAPPARGKASERTVGVAAAVADRLDAVLALCTARGGARPRSPRASVGTLVSAAATG